MKANIFNPRMSGIIPGTNLTNLLLYLLSSCILISHASHSYGQDNKPQGTIQEAEFIIKKERKNELAESTRLFKKAPLPTTTDQPSFQPKYELDDLFMTFQPIEHKIKILRAKQDRLERLYGSYIRLGYGNAHRPYGVALFNNSRNPKYAYGLQLGHISEGKNEYAEGYHQAAALHGKMLTQQLVLDGSMDYMWNKHPFIEAINNPQHTANDPNKNHTYHQIGLSTRLYNYVPDTLNYQAQAQVLHLHQEKVHENQGKANVQVGYQLNEIIQLHTDAAFQVSQYTNPATASMTRHITSLRPSLIILFQNLAIHAGASLAYQDDKQALPNNFYAHPTIKLTYSLSKSLRPYIELNGGIQPHSWQLHVSQNPWLAPSADIRHTNQSFILAAGFQSDVLETLTSHAGVSVSSYQNYPCFVNHAAEPRNFDIQYDSSATVVHGFIELTKTSFGAALVTRFKAAYFHYKLTDLLKPWHQPQYNFELCNNYNFHDKIFVKTSLLWQGGVEAQEPDTKVSKSLPDVIDLCLGIEYLWNKRLSLFVDCQNMLAKDNNHYLHAPTRGIHVMMGLAYGW